MILVTGATSAVGQAVIKDLLARKVAVRAFVRKQADATKFQAQGVEPFLGDMREPESAARALQGLESMYLIAPAGEHLAEIERLWIEEARKVGLPHLVKQSEIGADPHSFSPLLQVHGETEAALRASGIPYTLLRTLYLMQNFAPKYAGSLITQGKMYAPLGDARVSYIDAADVGAVAVQLLCEPQYQRREYDVTGPEAVSCTQLATIFSSLLQRPIQYENVSDAEAEQALLALYPPQLAHAVMTLLQFYRQGGGDLVTPVVADITGHQPRTAATFIKDHLQAFQPVAH